MTNHVIIAGFGIVGRAAAEAMEHLAIPYCVVERNAETVKRCQATTLQIVAGDVTEESVLRDAGIANAAALAVAMPNEPDALRAVEVARKLNPSIKIIARCTFSSSGLQATRLGANIVVVAEQVVAREFARQLETQLLPMREQAARG